MIDQSVAGARPTTRRETETRATRNGLPRCPAVIEGLGQFAAAARQQQPGAVKGIGRRLDRREGRLQARFAQQRRGARRACSECTSSGALAGIQFVARVEDSKRFDLVAANRASDFLVSRARLALRSFRNPNFQRNFSGYRSQQSFQLRPQFARRAK